MRQRRRIVSQSFASVIRAYLASDKFKSLSANTKDGYLRYLKRAEAPETLGALSTEEIRPALVQAFLDGLSTTPGAQQRAQIALKAVEQWAVVRDLLPYPITTGTEVIKSKGGHKPWSEDQVAHAEKHASDRVSRAITLASNTGQRGVDIVKMRWTDLEQVGGHLGINVTQQKTGRVLWIPFSAEMLAKLRTWERRPPFFLLGHQMTRIALTNAWDRDRVKDPALADLVFHGLRATAVIRLRRAGARPTQISDMVGMSVKMVEHYCRFADQRENAMAAVHYLDRTARERVTPQGNPEVTPKLLK